MDWIELIVALAVILFGAQLFTNGVEWIGERLGLSQGAVGSVLAAIGTALPETLLPLIAILTGGAVSGDEIGVGAIVGAPFMLSTLAMFVLGASLVGFARGGGRGTRLLAEAAVVRQDLAFFIGMYGLGVLAGVLHARAVRWALAPLLLVATVRPREELEREVALPLEQVRAWHNTDVVSLLGLPREQAKALARPHPFCRRQHGPR